MRLLLALPLLITVPAVAQAQIADPQIAAPPIVGPVPTGAPPAPPRAERRDGAYSPGYIYEREKTRDDIKAAKNSGRLSAKAAKSLKREARRTDFLAGFYARDGLSASEARELEMRASAIQSLAGAAGTGSSKRGR